MRVFHQLSKGAIPQLLVGLLMVLVLDAWDTGRWHPQLHHRFVGLTREHFVILSNWFSPRHVLYINVHSITKQRRCSKFTRKRTVFRDPPVPPPAGFTMPSFCDYPEIGVDWVSGHSQVAEVKRDIK